MSQGIRLRISFSLCALACKLPYQFKDPISPSITMESFCKYSFRLVRNFVACGKREFSKGQFSFVALLGKFCCCCLSPNKVFFCRCVGLYTHRWSYCLAMPCYGWVGLGNKYVYINKGVRGACIFYSQLGLTRILSNFLLAHALLIRNNWFRFYVNATLVCQSLLLLSLSLPLFFGFSSFLYPGARFRSKIETKN